MNQRINRIANKIQKRLIQEGFVIHRYDSHSSNSVYLKLDYGVANSIRISDHKGYKHLKYRYNVLTTIDTKYEDKTSKYPRFYYAPRFVHNMINQILYRKKTKIEKYGLQAYQDEMEKYRQNSQSALGFWQYAIEIKKEDSK